MKKGLFFLTMASIILIIGCSTSGVSKNKKAGGGTPLTLAEIDPALAKLGGSYFSINDGDAVVEYVKIGDAAYDDFFLGAAKLNGLVILCKAMTGNATAELKKLAMSKAADEAMKDNVQELVGGKPSEEWTSQETIAIMKMAKQQKKIGIDEFKYFATTAGSMGLAVISLAKGIKEAKELLPKAQELLKNATKLSPLKIPKATKGVKGSIGNLKGVVQNAPPMLEEMTVLISAFKAIK